jgi:predicted amidohydrolase YtcJ
VQLAANPEQPRQASTWGFTRRLNDREQLDTVSPKNPVLVRPGLRGNVNSAALKILNEVLPGYNDSIQESMHGVDIGEDISKIGWVGSQEMAAIQWEVLMRSVDNNTLAQMLKLVSEEWASIGVTTWSTRIPMPKVMSGYAKLQELGQMPIRLSAHYEVHRAPSDPEDTRVFYKKTGVLQGIGGDYMWFDGIASERWDSHLPEACVGPDMPAPAAIKSRETCPKPGDLHWDTLQNAIRSGWRMTGVHMCGSESLRRMVQMIDQVIKEGTLTLEQVRQQQYSLEHCDMIGKKPEIIDLLKRYNFIISCGPDYIRESWGWLKDYGPTNPNVLDHLIPFNTWIKSGVNLVGQHYGGGTLRGGEGGGEGFQPPFFMLWQSITRKYDGKVWTPEERIDRVHALKMWTRWAANYVRRPDRLGSLEPGKWADLMVIDRDYFTIPEDDILKIRPLMTVVGGKTMALNESLAKEWGVEAVGPQFTFEDSQLEWIGKAFTDDSKRTGSADSGLH